MRVLNTVGMALVMAVPAALCQTTEQQKVLFAENFEQPDQTGTLPADWTHFTHVKTVSLCGDQVYEGKHSLRVVDDDPKIPVGLRSSHFKVTPGQYVWVSWWYYGERAHNQAMYIEFWTAKGTRPRNRGRSWSCRGKGKWIGQIQWIRVPPGAATATVHANSYSTNVATGYFDKLEVGTGARFMYDRKPRPPVSVKHPCGLYKEADVERAKRNLEKHAWAKRVLEGFKSSASFWMECPDDKLSYWIPARTPFRVVDCPKCGAGWRFAWTGNDRRIKCRDCSFTWPHADYPEQQVQTFVDPVGEPQEIPYYEGKPSTRHGSAQSRTYRLSGRLRYNRVSRLSRLGSLGKVYALTGDLAYAQGVRRVLLRLAEVYPHYLPHDWNRVFEDYGNLQSGKLSGWKLHDAGVFIQLATAYDLTYNSGVYSEEDKAQIEEGCFREFARLMTATSPRGCCINDGPTAMAAGALAGLMLGDHDFIAWAANPPDGFLGFVEDYFRRDGHWYEASPSYEGMSLANLYITPEALRGYTDPPSYGKPDRFDDLDLFGHPLMAKMLVAGAYERMPDGRLPATNDSTFGARYPSTRAEQNYFWYPTERNRRLMCWAFGGQVQSTGNEYTLFRRDPDLDFSGVEPLAPSSRSVVRPDVGWAILRTGDGPSDAALMIDYGPHGGGHGHPDRLNIIYYDYGKELVTDLGYLGWGHRYHLWMRSAASHNHVIVDGKPQGGAGGMLEAFCGEGPVQVAICSAPKVYAGVTDTYRRYVLLVDGGGGERYVVDLFEVKGGKDHQYVFHADGETFTPPALEFEDVQRSALGEARTGYTWLKGLKAAPAPGTFTCEWVSDEKRRLGTRLHVLAGPHTELIYGKAPGLRNRSRPFDEVDLYPVYVRRPGPHNRFVAVIEAFEGESAPSRVRELEVTTKTGRATGVEVRRGERTDIVVIADETAAAGEMTLPAYPDVRFTGRMAFVSLRGNAPTMLWMIGGELLAYGDTSLRSTARYEGRIAAIDQAKYCVTVDVDIPPGLRHGLGDARRTQDRRPPSPRARVHIPKGGRLHDRSGCQHDERSRQHLAKEIPCTSLMARTRTRLAISRWWNTKASCTPSTWRFRATTRWGIW